MQKERKLTTDEMKWQTCDMQIRGGCYNMYSNKDSNDVRIYLEGEWILKDKRLQLLSSFLHDDKMRKWKEICFFFFVFVFFFFT